VLPKQISAIYIRKLFPQTVEVLLLRPIRMRFWLVLAKLYCQAFALYKCCVRKLHELFHQMGHKRRDSLLRSYYSKNVYATSNEYARLSNTFLNIRGVRCHVSLAPLSLLTEASCLIMSFKVCIGTE
jgi:hypothetical protein